jgi:hypothetical protein
MPAWANSLGDHILKNPFTKKAGGLAQDVCTEIKPQKHTHKKE